MRPVLVVPLEEASEAVSAVVRALENLEVEALAEHGADPAFRLAVGLRVVGASEAMAQLSRPAHSPPGLGPVGGAIVREQTVDADALGPKPAQRTDQKMGRGPPLLVAEHLRIDQPAAIVDGHVEHLPAHSLALEAVVTVDAMPGPTDDAPELLGVAVHHGAWGAELVAVHRRPCRSLALQSLTPDHPMHRGRRDPAQHGQAVGSPPGLPAHGRDRRLLHERQTLRRMPWTAAPIEQPRRALCLPARSPAVV